ncbi:hypothetical protein ABZV93_03075 [Actinopolymorpha sp. NPDC004070]|uniref:hypothetical protein n=1 Tax=Actinopolymorpha sp. NPDC004070 TaxID=3154548 RepID=UPI0033ABAB40
MVTTRVLVAYATRNRATGHPVWLFGSGPLDRSAEEHEIPPVDTARDAAEKVHARGHRTFGGRLREDARGFFGLARRMGRRGTADYRDEQAIDSWAHEPARELGADGSPTGRPPSGGPSS